MPETLSRRIFVVELWLVTLPFSLAYLTFGVMYFVVPGMDFDAWYLRTISCLGVLVLAAVLGAWVLILAYLRGGAAALRRRHAAWWMVSLGGAVVVGASVASRLLPPSPEYSDTAMFREALQNFALGLPLLLPLAHLAMERLRNVAR